MSDKKEPPEVAVQPRRPGEIRHRPTLREVFWRHWDEIRHSLPPDKGGRDELRRNAEGKERALELLDQGCSKNKACEIAATEIVTGSKDVAPEDEIAVQTKINTMNNTLRRWIVNR